jgi:hypothetical protein
MDKLDACVSLAHNFDAEHIRRLVAATLTERHFTSYFGELLALKLRSRFGRLPAEDAQETFVRFSPL